MIMLLQLTKVDDVMCFKRISFLFLVQKKRLEVKVPLVVHWLLFHPTTILSNKGSHFVCLLLTKNYQMHSKA